jgi:hypothetical protein
MVDVRDERDIPDRRGGHERRMLSVYLDATAGLFSLGGKQ